MEIVMRSSIAAVALVFAMAIGIDHAAAAAADAATPNPRTPHKSHSSAHRGDHVGGRPHSSYYLGRPTYYSPGPLFPWLPFISDWRDPLDW
jgi:hypothetical protein